MQGFLVFRPPADAGELREHFRLRHDVYLHHGFRLSPHPTGLDVDPYDPFSQPLAAWRHGPDGSARMVGGIRMIWERRPSPLRPWLTSILASQPSLREEVGARRGARLPSERAFDYSAVLSGPRRRREEVVEFSRTFSLPEEQGRHVGVSLAHGIHALARVHGVRTGIGSCSVELTPYYEKVGAVVVESAGLSDYPGIGVVSRAVSVSLESLPAPADRLTRRIATSLRTFGSFCACLLRADLDDGRCTCGAARLREAAAVERGA